MLQSLNAPKPGEDTPAGEAALETFYYDDAIVRRFMTAMLLWAAVSMLVGLFIALQLVFPSLNFGQPSLTFARLRPLHTNAAIYAFAGNALFCAIYYSTQRLCKARMWSGRLSTLHFWSWQLIIVSAAFTLPMGISRGRVYAELEWPINLAIAGVWIVFFGGNFFMTVAHRRERHLYVALWFYIATIVTVAVMQVFNCLIVPVGLLKSYPIFAGVQDALMQWWYGHNAVAFLLTVPFLGLMYYFLPKAAGRPVFSYRLSIVHFWSLVLIYFWAGPHHLLNTSAPDWLQTLAMVFSVMLWMPSWGGMINGLLTLRGTGHKVSTDVVLKFFVVALIFYGISTVEGPLLSVKAVDSVAHFTDWTLAHVHGGTLGWVGFMSFGMMYWLLPRLFQSKLHSDKAAHLHFWIGTIGIVVYVIPLYVAGLTQGLMWRAMNDSGQLVFPDFLESVRASTAMWFLRGIGGSLYLAGVVLAVWNYYMTWHNRPPRYDETAQYAPRLRRRYADDTVPPISRFDNVAEVGRKLDVFSSMWFHRKLERKPAVFALLVVLAIVVAAVFEVVPTVLVRSNVPAIASVKPYTPLELIGRDIYIGEGCVNCHSQQVRPMLSEVRRYGEYSKAGEFAYDHPALWGNRRIGPDLAREGGKNLESWHLLHFQDPPQVRPGSVMPEYTWLIGEKIDFASIPNRVRAMQIMGVPYTAVEYDDAIPLAKAQATAVAEKIATQMGQPAMKSLEDKQVVAVIAYLQRLGTDLFAPAPAAATQPVITSGSQSH